MTQPSVCFYFQVHQPYRLDDVRIRDIGTEKVSVFDDETNATIFRKVAQKCYLPANAVLLKMLQSNPDWHVSFSLSGVFLDQCEEYGKDVLDSFRALVATGQVELLAETYEHSLAALRSTGEFCRQVERHVRRVQELFGITPKVFRNTELIYSNDIAEMVRMMGFRGMLAEGADHILQGRSPCTPYHPPRIALNQQRTRLIRAHRPHARASRSLHILLKHYRLSDDIAFRFSDRNWNGYPLHADTFASWVAEQSGFTVNLFMDYETFGEHQWAESGIFDFLAALPDAFTARGIRTRTPSQTIDAWNGETPLLDVHSPMSWADSERDLSAWLGNDIQCSALDALFALEADVLRSKDEHILRIWRRLQTSDHLYYMCTKYWHDGDVHKYFSPYDSPYEAYRRFSHALCDLQRRIGSKTQSSSCTLRAHSSTHSA